MKKFVSVFVIIIFGLMIFSDAKLFPASDQIMTDKKNTKFAGYKCSDSWRITGYFTPIETEYDSNETREIEIRNVGKMKFNTDFFALFLMKAKVTAKVGARRALAGISEIITARGTKRTHRLTLMILCLKS